MNALILAAVLAVGATGEAKPPRACVEVPVTDASPALVPCEQEWGILAFYIDPSGEVSAYSPHLEVVCGERDAKARTDEIEARGFESDEGRRVTHAAVRLISYFAMCAR